MPVRFKIVTLSVLAVFICYIDRVNISITIIPMAKELGWNYERIGLVSASFFVPANRTPGSRRDRQDSPAWSANCGVLGP